jgi:putative membrane protein (TIGR04086 family)
MAVADRPARSAPAPESPRDDEHRIGGFGVPRISFRAVLAGLVAGQVLLIFVTNGGLILADNAFGPQDRLDGGVVGMATFLAVIVGGFVAGRVAGRNGVWHGMMVGIGFIVIAILYEFADEVRLVHDSFQVTGGPRNLIDLGPMRIDQVITGDLLALFGGSVGGFLARRK